MKRVTKSDNVVDDDDDDDDGHGHYYFRRHNSSSYESTIYLVDNLTVSPLYQSF